ncbi:C6 transcription factor [Apiospora saccharicola]|uniref:C6 transcription factor n=1 Tax=Apiospora saccharicola TaxID=335842 RepID=A0ABR1W0Q2_9PEZI
MERGPVVRSAGYGQACHRCTKAKCRCVLRAQGDGCERCHRLKRVCQPSESQQRHAADGQQQEVNGRIAALEGELGHLVAQLKARQVLADSERHPDTDTTAAPQEPQPPAGPSGSSLVAPTSSATFSRNEPTPLVHHDPVAAPLDTAATPERVEEDDLLLATCLDKFSSSMLPCFPFIHFGCQPTVAQLRRHRPQLLRAIVCVAWPFAREKRSRALELKRTLFQAFHMRQERERRQQQEEETESSSIDLLLAILTYVAWGWDHVHGGGGGLSYLMMPCMSLVGEMFLDRPSPPNLRTATMFDEPRMAIPPSPETRCALLGCFVLSSAIASFFANMDAMHWTPPMEEALAALSGGNDAFSSHTGLILHVRLRLLSLKAGKLCWKSQPHQERQMELALPVDPVDTDGDGLLRQLQELRRSASTPSGHLQRKRIYHHSLVPSHSDA